MKNIYNLKSFNEHKNLVPVKTGIKELFSTLFFNFAILFFIIGFGFTDTPTPFGWYQQFMPFLNNRPISDITFLDSLTGYAVTSYTANDTVYIIKTNNGGDNWNVIFNQPTNVVGGFNRIEFINQNTGFAGGNFIYKTTNSGISWIQMNNPVIANDMFVLNNDTIWFVNPTTGIGGVFRTTNGGASWVQQVNFGSGNPAYIYMYNARIGFIAPTTNSGTPYTRKTTDGGQTWSSPLINEGFTDIHFVDSLTGWKANNGSMEKTTDGGTTWINQSFPPTYITGVIRFSNVNRDTIWGVGGRIGYPNNQVRGIIYNTTDGGNNWRYQLPDTSIRISGYLYNKFVNELNGWAYSLSNGVHTVTGGNDTNFTGLKQISSNVPEKYILGQNYPNPFNPVTKIKYYLTEVRGSKLEVRLIVYNILGKEIKTIVNQLQGAGEYEVTFDGSNYSSGVYFYSLYADGILVDTKKMILLK